MKLEVIFKYYWKFLHTIRKKFSQGVRNKKEKLWVYLHTKNEKEVNSLNKKRKNLQAGEKKKIRKIKKKRNLLNLKVLTY